MLSNIIKIIIIAGMVLGLAYAGACIYGNISFNMNSDKDIADTFPSEQKATYEVYEGMKGRVVNTKAFTNDYEWLEDGLLVHDYWQWSGKKWVDLKGDLLFPYSVYGDNIKVKLRGE